MVLKNSLVKADVQWHGLQHMHWRLWFVTNGFPILSCFCVHNLYTGQAYFVLFVRLFHNFIKRELKSTKKKPISFQCIIVCQKRPDIFPITCAWHLTHYWDIYFLKTSPYFHWNIEYIVSPRKDNILAVNPACWADLWQTVLPSDKQNLVRSFHYSSSGCQGLSLVC